MEQDDILNHNDRRRVLIYYGFPALRDGHIFSQVRKDKRCVVFKYDFASDIFEIKGVMTLNELRNEFVKLEEEPLFEILTKTAGITYKNIKKSLCLCMLNYAPGGTFNPSILKYDKDVIGNLFKLMHDTMLEPDEKSIYNEQFNNKMIKELIDCQRFLAPVIGNLGNNTFILSIDYPTGDSTDIIMTDIEVYIDNLRKQLIASDMITLIRNEHKKCKLIIIELVNCMRSYFLLAHYEKTLSDEYIFTYIPSPNDNSLLNV